MPRIRTVKPEFYSDPDLGRLSLEARYLYKGTWSFCDDEGRISADPRLLKSQIFPFDDKVGVRKVRSLVEELSKARKVLPYRVRDVDYLWLPNFRSHQVINKPQPPKYPVPPPELVESFYATVPTPLPDEERPITAGYEPTRYEGNRPPPPPEGGGGVRERELQEHLVAEGYHEDDVTLVVKKIVDRDTFGGDRIKDPVGWATTHLEKLTKARYAATFNGNGATKEAIDVDGTRLRFENGQWVEVDA